MGVGPEDSEMADWQLDPNIEPPSIHTLMDAVREHPDFVFGTIFSRGDFPNDTVPEDFPTSHATDALVERGNLLIEDLCGGEEREAYSA